MRLGIFARTFDRPDLESALDAVAATGLTTMQFNVALAGGPSLPEEVPAERIRAACEHRGLSTAAVSGTYNMAHPDAGVRADGLRRLGVLIRAAPALGTRVVTLCTGTRDPGDMWRRHPDNGSAEAWRDMLAAVSAAVGVAEAHDVTLAVEPEHGNVVADAPAARRLLDEVRSPRLRVVIDAANLVEGTDRDGDLLRRAFDLLGDDVVLAHAKDVRRDGTVAAPGRGDVDFPLYLTLLAQTGRDVPLVMHGLAEDEVPGSLAFLRAALSP